MSKVICCEVSCKYNNDNYECTNKKISLAMCSINTLYQGNQTYLKCKSYKERNDEWYKNVKELIEKCVKEENKTNE